MYFYRNPKNRLEALEALARSYNLIKSVSFNNAIQPLLDAIATEANKIKAGQEKEEKEI